MNAVECTDMKGARVRGYTGKKVKAGGLVAGGRALTHSTAVGKQDVPSNNRMPGSNNSVVFYQAYKNACGWVGIVARHTRMVYVSWSVVSEITTFSTLLTVSGSSRPFG